MRDSIQACGVGPSSAMVTFPQDESEALLNGSSGSPHRRFAPASACRGVVLWVAGKVRSPKMSPNLGCALMDEIDQECQDGESVSVSDGDAELDDETAVLVEAVEVTDEVDDMDAIPVYATIGGD